ncbi:MAG: hypothetical protein EPN64_07135 [Burkholderiaceae bacterium]|jgi:hypothetical protein|nr:MAG: hypothetical protein EPN64_07135 [Burkholderiaceae bacterium]
MRRAVLAIVLAVFFSMASASPGPDRAVNSADAATQATLQPVSSDVDVVAVVGAKQLPRNAADDASAKDDSDWRGYGMLFATLVLMAVIAVRRQRR